MAGGNYAMSEPEANGKLPAQDSSLVGTPERASWGRPLEFILACLGYAVGLGNVWRFPYLCYRNGGGAFLIPFFLMMILIGLPLFYLELYIGQFTSYGPLKAFAAIGPFYTGLGYCTLVVISLISIYYMIIVAWTLFYTIVSLAGNLDWGSCENEFNTNYVAEQGPGLAFVAYPEALLQMPIPQFWSILFFLMLFILGLGSQFADVAEQGPGLAFVAYPEALLQMPIPQFWSILFFLMLFILGLGSQFAGIEAINTAIVDQWPQFRKEVTAFTCFTCFILGIPMCFSGGVYLFTLMDWNTASWAILLIGMAESIAVAWTYGINRAMNDLASMNMKLNKVLRFYWKAAWTVTVPIASLRGKELFTPTEKWKPSSKSLSSPNTTTSETNQQTTYENLGYM
ncbi:unnamed protein product, partial [Iphiclides podalirius]